MVRLIILLFICSPPLIGCVYGPYNTSGRVVLQDDHGLVDIAFSDHDKAIIHDYHYGHGHKKKKKGAASWVGKER